MPGGCTGLVITYEASWYGSENPNDSPSNLPLPSSIQFDSNTRQFTISKCPSGGSGDSDCDSFELGSFEQQEYQIDVLVTLNSVESNKPTDTFSFTIKIGPDCLSDVIVFSSTQNDMTIEIARPIGNMASVDTGSTLQRLYPGCPFSCATNISWSGSQSPGMTTSNSEEGITTWTFSDYSSHSSSATVDVTCESTDSTQPSGLRSASDQYTVNFYDTAHGFEITFGTISQTTYNYELWKDGQTLTVAKPTVSLPEGATISYHLDGNLLAISWQLTDQSGQDLVFTINPDSTDQVDSIPFQVSACVTIDSA